MFDDYYRKPQRGSWYDAAQICTNGHLITSSVHESPETCRARCEKCGSQTITKCPSCNEEIKGYYHIEGVAYPFYQVIPQFCEKCGSDFPWTSQQLKVVEEMIGMLSLSDEDEKNLKEDIKDLIQDTPRAKVAAFRTKKLINSIGRQEAEALRSVLMDVVSKSNAASLGFTE